MSSTPTSDRAAEQLPHEHGELTVLLVEDDEGDALIFEDLLAQAKPWATLVRAGTVAQAELMLRTPVDCVMLDLGLPDAAGLDALHRISRRVEDVPIIVLTGDGDGRRGVEAVAAGAQDYLVKGEVDPPTLRRAIRYGIERCRAEASERKLHDAELQARESARLERGLLPRPVVSDPRVRVRTGSRPGRAQTLLGGDFFDIIETADGTLQAVIGDVSGHGPDEAALGVCLRVAWRALILAGANPARALAGIEEVLVHERTDPDQFATVASVCIPADRDKAHLLVAGHPPPVLLSPGRAPVVLPVRTGPPLGVVPGVPQQPTQADLPDAWSLLLYTDGLIEGHADGGETRLGEDRFVRVLADLYADTGDDGLLARMIARVEAHNGGPLTDDVAALLVGVDAR
ncbi:MAG: PP2C family protein-serine/threonine phosphatase [Solirubrobacteraceae bacterium]